MIAVQGLSIRLGAFRLADVSFAVPAGEYGVLMGKTGCGKTTILEAICGLRSIQSGRILLGEHDVTHLRPAERGIGFVPQDGALFTNMTVREHLEFALVIRGWSAEKRRARVDEMAELLGIGHLLGRRPFGLSGGERQRTALGRALSWRPQVLCLDEPLNALDSDTLDEICTLLRRISRETGVTTLHITHNLHETRRLADRVLRLDGGVVREEPAAEDQPMQRSEGP